MLQKAMPQITQHLLINSANKTNAAIRQTGVYGLGLLAQRIPSQ
jgi:hypothetical protein